MNLYKNIFNGNIKLEKAQEDKEQIELDLNEITRGFSQKKSSDQIKTIKNIKNLINQKKKLSNCKMIMLKLHLKLSKKQNTEQHLKY